MTFVYTENNKKQNKFKHDKKKNPFFEDSWTINIFN